MVSLFPVKIHPDFSIHGSRTLSVGGIGLVNFNHLTREIVRMTIRPIV